MKKTTIFIFALLSSILAEAQIKLKCSSLQELKEQKAKLIESSDFEALIPIQKEIESRTEAEAKSEIIQNKISIAVAAEDFELAASLKKELNVIESGNKTRIKNCNAYNKAVSTGDYEEAARLKKAINSAESQNTTQTKKVTKEKPIVKKASETKSNETNTSPREPEKKYENIDLKEDLKFSKSKISFGPILGYNFATQTTSVGSVQSGGKDNASGLLIGGFGLYRLSFIDVNAQLMFTSLNSPSISKSFSVLRVPLMASYNINEQFSAFAGPEFNISLSEKSTYTRSLNAGFIFGGSYNINKSFFTSISYRRGLTNMVSLPGYVAKMHFISLTAGYKIKK